MPQVSHQVFGNALSANSSRSSSKPSSATTVSPKQHDPHNHRQPKSGQTPSRQCWCQRQKLSSRHRQAGAPYMCLPASGCGGLGCPSGCELACGVVFGNGFGWSVWLAWAGSLRLVSLHTGTGGRSSPASANRRFSDVSSLDGSSTFVAPNLAQLLPGSPNLGLRAQIRCRCADPFAEDLIRELMEVALTGNTGGTTPLGRRECLCQGCRRLARASEVRECRAGVRERGGSS